MKKNKLPLALITALLVAFITACGGGDNMEVMAPVVVENTIVSEKTEEPIKEVDTDATYAEYNKLEFTKDTEITTKGILYVGNDIGTLEVIDVDWKITNITISEAEDGIQTIIIEQESHGYIGVDDTGNIFATNLNIPVGRLCDCFTGIMIPVNKIEDESETKTDAEIDFVDITETKIEWKDKSYTISATESVIWEDADWSTGWIEAPSGKGEILPSTLKVRTEITVTEGYEGLALVLVPITDADGSVYGKRIMDAWTEGSYIFNVSELSAKFENAEEDATKTETTATPAPTEIPTPTEKPVEEEKPAETTEKPVESPKPAVSTPQPTETPQPVHVHNYNGVVTTQPSCSATGVKTFTCNCGASYTESIGTTAHDYSIPITQTVHHEDQYEAVRREIPERKVIVCGCGAEFSDTSEWNNHCVAMIEENGPFCACGSNYLVNTYPASYTYDYVLTTPAYDSEEIVGYKCSVCGTTK